MPNFITIRLIVRVASQKTHGGVASTPPARASVNIDGAQSTAYNVLTYLITL